MRSSEGEGFLANKVNGNWKANDKINFLSLFLLPAIYEEISNE
jgi:hypothetical protein